MPTHDMEELQAAGIAAVMTPGATAAEVVATMADVLSR